MKKHSRVQTLILAAVLLVAGSAFAQERQMRDTDTLKIKIEQMEQIDLSSKAQSAQSLYRCTLYRLYNEYSQALKQEMADLKSMQAASRGTSSDPNNDLGARLRGLSSELSITTEKMRTLEGDLSGRCAPGSSSAPAAAPPEQPKSQLVDTAYRQSNVTRERTIADSRVSLDAVPTSDTVSRNSPFNSYPQIVIQPPKLEDNVSTTAKKVKGTGAIGGATIEVFLNDPDTSKAPEIATGVAAPDGTFSIPLKNAASNPVTLSEDDQLWVRQKIGNEYSLLSTPAVKVVAPKKAEQVALEAGDVEPRGAVGYLIGGSVISNQAQRFSQADPFFGFLAGYTSRWRGADRRFGRFNMRFQGVFTAQPRTATAPQEDTAAPAPGTTLNQELPFLSSRKTFDVDLHMWWDFPVSKSNFLSIGPYAAVGASTALDKNELLGEDVRVGAKDAGVAPVGTGGNEIKLDGSEAKSDNDMKMYWEVGPLIQITIPGKGLFLQSMLTYGRYEALRGLYVDSNGVEQYDTQKRFRGQLRIFPLAVARGFGKQTKLAPMFGVDLNASRGPDSLRFFSGFIVNISAITKAKEEDKK
jgi:hypothetical protein